MYKVPLCHCGHDKDSHHERKHTCLAIHCDCTSYRDETKPDPDKLKPKTLPPSGPDFSDDDDAPVTPRMPWFPGKWP